MYNPPPLGGDPSACGDFVGWPKTRRCRRRSLKLEGRLMNIEPPAMPYDFADLEPAMSRDTLVFHFLRHQRVCFDRMLTMVRGSELEALPLDELIRVTERVPAQHALFRYAAEVWNHNLFWRSMRPRGGGAAHGAVGEHIRTRFGSYERFTREFKETASAQFGSGWLWLGWRGAGGPSFSRRHTRGPPGGGGAGRAWRASG